MVIENSTSLISLLEKFDPNDIDQIKILKSLLKRYPNFQLVRTYYLKAIRSLNPDNFDKILSHTAIATYDRKLLYDFIESPTKPISIQKLRKKDKKIQDNNQKETLVIDKILSKKKKKKSPKSMSFSEWAKYLQENKIPSKKGDINKKFELIEAFLEKQEKMIPKRHIENNEDLSEKSWASTDELMTETLAKVFIKQKKYEKALEAYQILGLKYPEKNSFFANQIKRIKNLIKTKE